MQNICTEYVIYMDRTCTKYARDPKEIFIKNAEYEKKNHKLCTKYARKILDVSRICRICRICRI